MVSTNADIKINNTDPAFSLFISTCAHERPGILTNEKRTVRFVSSYAVALHNEFRFCFKLMK